MMEMRERKLFLWNLSVFEHLSGREKAGKLECSKNIESSCVFKDVCVLLLKEPNTPPPPAAVYSVYYFIKAIYEVCEAYRFRKNCTKRMGFYLLLTLPFSEDAQKNTPKV